MRTFMFVVATLATTPGVFAQDTASVTYVPSLGIYVLFYGYDGVTYTDTLEPANKIEPTITCGVTFEPTTAKYEYSYAVGLASASIQYLLAVSIEHLVPIQDVQKPSERWDMGEMSGRNIWDWSNTNIDSSGLRTEVTDVGPNQSLGGFGYKSSGLPTIVRSYFEGNRRPFAFSGEPPLQMQELLDPILTFPNDQVVRPTLGPILPPSPFIALAFLDTLIAMKNEAKTLNWIQPSDLSDLIDTRLSKARDHLESEDESGALEDLQVALSAVEHDCLGMGGGPGVSYLTSEACALLRYNIEYLMEQID